MPVRFKTGVILWGLALVPSFAHAAGFAIFEQGARAMGFGGAFTAQASDPSAIFHNAAGIAFLKGTQVYFGGTLIAAKSNFTGADPFPGAGVTERSDAGIVIPPTAYLTRQFTEDLVLGIGFDTPFGLRTRWQNRDTTYSGRFLSKNAELNGFSLNPTIAYKLADRLAVGGGVDIRFSSVTLDRNVASTNPFTLKTVDVAAAELKSSTKTGIGFNLGIIAKPSESLSIGASYRHKVKIDYAGTATFTLLPTGDSSFDAIVARRLPTGSIPATTSIDFPSFLSGGVAYAFNDWTVEGDVNWYQWSTFKELVFTLQGRPDLSQVLPENYTSQLQYRVGLERRLNDRFIVRGGYYFDKTPAPPAAVSPILPDADRNGIALGVTFKSGRFRVDVANLYTFFKERSTEGVSRDHYDGIYKNSAELFAISIGYGF
jgi:long-chain fatty acid transport protein